MKLTLPRRTKRRLPQRVQQPRRVEARVNAEWSMDFMSDTLHYGGRTGEAVAANIIAPFWPP